jgi:hypothetical protein
VAKNQSAGTETKTGFLRKVLTKNPDLDHRQVNRLWTKRGHSGQISNALFYQIRAKLGIKTEWVWVKEGQPVAPEPEPLEAKQQETTTDPLVEAAQNNLPLILALYKLFEGKRPVMLFDLQSQKIYAYPYMEYKANLNERSQAILERQYQEAITEDKIVVFVRDNESQRLTSMVLDKD